MPAKTPVPLTEGELKLIRRLRGLPAGVHLATIQTTSDEVVALVILSSSKPEKLAPKENPGGYAKGVTPET